MNKYEKYLKRPNAKIPQHNVAIIEKGEDISLDEVLKIEDKNKILTEKSCSTENGFYHYKDGSAYAAVLTHMPNVTIEMIDWWFWWHPKEPVRYKLWYPEMHFDTAADFGGHYDDESKTYRERLQLSTHFVTEDIGTGTEKIIIDFMSPEEFGFDKSNLDEDRDLVICARVGSFDKKVWHTRMCHAVRKVEQGIEMRSRFWMGMDVKRMDGFGQKIINSILNNSFVKKNLMPKNIGKFMFHHCTQEYNNMGGFLPEIYAEEKA